MADHVETTLPVLVFTTTAVPGSSFGHGKLVIDNDDGSNNQWTAIWGIQSRHYSSAASAALFYQAEALTAMGGSATNAGPAGASGSSVMRNTALTTSYQAVLSTQATGGGAHMTHVGSYRVFARVQTPTTNTGTVTVGLEWGEGDFRRFTQNTGVALDPNLEGAWQFKDLGLITLSEVLTGSQRWEGRVIAKSTVSGDDIDIDYLAFFPVDEGYGEASGVNQVPTPTVLAFQDEFASTTAGNSLSGRVAPTGGTWALAGENNNMVFADAYTGEQVSRDGGGLNDSANGRFGILGSTDYTNTTVRCRITRGATTSGSMKWGVIARYVDTSNWLAFRATNSGGSAYELVQCVAGTLTVLDENTFGQSLISSSPNWARLELEVIGGTAYARAYDDSTGILYHELEGSSAALATGGVLATGKPGINAYQTSTSGATLYFDEFFGSTSQVDAAVFAGQSLEIRHNGVVREDSSGSYWQPPSRYQGDYLRVPPAGAEGRTLRVIVKLLRNDPATGPDSGIDDVSAKMYVTPLFLAVPDA